MRPQACPSQARRRGRSLQLRSARHRPPHEQDAAARGQLLETLAGVLPADAVIAAAPVYKAGISGLFKSFVDVLDNDLLIAKPVVLAAAAGSSRHALVVDEQMRSLFAYMRALTLPTSVFAAPEDWGAAELGERVRADELRHLQEIEEEGQSPATPVIMAGSVW